MSIVLERSALPNLIVIGAAKCGTTSLHRYLQLHPEISMASPGGNRSSLDNDSDAKEMRFFWRDDWRQNLRWYRSHFEAMDTPVKGEATPAYSAHPFHPGVAGRIHSIIPEARLIYIVRDPIDRIVAHHVQQQVDGERRTLAEWAAAGISTDDRIICPSLYATQLEQYLQYFSSSQLLVLDQWDLRRNRRSTLREVFEFVDVEVDFWSDELGLEHNTRSQKHVLTPVGRTLFQRVLDPVGKRIGRGRWRRLRPRIRRALAREVEAKPEVPPALRRELEQILQPEVERFRELTGKQFQSWSL